MTWRFVLTQVGHWFNNARQRVWRPAILAMSQGLEAAAVQPASQARAAAAVADGVNRVTMAGGSFRSLSPETLCSATQQRG